MSTAHNLRHPYLWLAIVLVGSVLVAGCESAASASNNPPASQSSPETRASIATAIALKAAQSAANPAKQVTPSGPRTVANISSTAPTSGLLDNVHLGAGKGCDACHGTIPAEGKPLPVTTTRCLSCHGGSYDAVAAKTSSLGARNPHKAHTGKEDCDRCHHVHRPFENSCNSCHSFPDPEKYQPRAASQVITRSTPAPNGSGSPIYREIED